MEKLNQEQLRELHNIHIIPYIPEGKYGKSEYSCKIHIINQPVYITAITYKNDVEIIDFGMNNTYDYVLEFAIEYANTKLVKINQGVV